MLEPGGLLSLILLLIGMPLVLAFVLGWIQARTLTPLVFWCRRCEHEFRQPPQRAFPVVCPRCRSRDWNA
jgi:hypothetical protein